jgi:hypothetical protein
MRGQFLTIGQLKKVIEQANLPDDTPVLYERIDDSYFDHGGWTTVDIDWETIAWEVAQRYPDYYGDLDRYDVRTISPIPTNDERIGPNGECVVEQCQGIKAFQAYKAWSRSLNCYVLFITPHY